MSAALVTLATAKIHLRIPVTDTASDTDIQLKLDQAEDLILTYLDTSVDATWLSPATTPGRVSAAILLALGDLYEERGDATAAVSANTWESITRLLVQSRNAAIA